MERGPGVVCSHGRRTHASMFKNMHRRVSVKCTTRSRDHQTIVLGACTKDAFRKHLKEGHLMVTQPAYFRTQACRVKFSLLRNRDAQPQEGEPV